MTDYQPSNFDKRIAEGLRGSAEFLANLLAAVFVVAILEAFLGKFIRVHAIQTLLIKAYALDFLAAFAVGYFVYRRWKLSTARWIWTVGVLWIPVRAVFLVSNNGAGFWNELIGLDLADPQAMRSHLFWWTLTLIAVRTVAYSLGAWICAKVENSGPSPFDDALLARFPPLNVEPNKD